MSCARWMERDKEVEEMRKRQDRDKGNGGKLKTRNRDFFWNAEKLVLDGYFIIR